jgi:Ca2+-binding RTX toxin-like protein
VKASNNGIAVGHSGLQMDPGEDLHLTFLQQQTNVSFILTQWQGNGTADVHFVVEDGATTLHDFDIHVVKPTSGDTHIVVEETSDLGLINSSNYTGTTEIYTLYVDQQFDHVLVDYTSAVTGNATFTVNNITYDEQTTIPTTDLQFNVTAVDGDGDQATTNLLVDLSGGTNVAAGITLTGTSANDVLVGGDGNDTLIGAAGSDTLTGGLGADHFRYNSSTEGMDKILDFTSAQNDVIDILGSAFGGIATGTLSSALFSTQANGTFDNTTERFSFDQSTHTLYYDADGSGGAHTAIALAQLENGAVLTNNNIHVV